MMTSQSRKEPSNSTSTRCHCIQPETPIRSWGQLNSISRFKRSLLLVSKTLTSPKSTPVVGVLPFLCVFWVPLKVVISWLWSGSLVFAIKIGKGYYIDRETTNDGMYVCNTDGVCVWLCDLKQIPKLWLLALFYCNVHLSSVGISTIRYTHHL